MKKIKKTLLVGTMILGMMGTVAYGKSVGDFYYKNANAWVHGYVDIQSNFLKSYVWCNVSLGGVDRACVDAKYNLKTSEKTIRKAGKLNYSNLSDSYTAVDGGAGADWARLSINYEGHTEKLEKKA